jgi:MYXO-CTERM domain-containing protein
MNTKLSGLVGAAALLLGVVGSGSALAQGTWNLGTYATTAGACNASGTPGTASCGAGVSGSTSGIQATMTGWSNAGGAFVQGSLQNNDPSGFGLISGSSETGTNSHHAFDNSTVNCGSGSTQTNCGGSHEFMLISFGSAKVNLSAMQIGYSGGDADISIYRWDGNAASITGSSLGAGWSLVSSMDVDTNGANCTNMNDPNAGCKQFNAADSVNGVVAGATNLYSSWWLISTYIGSANAAKNLESPNNNDAFKILSFTANTCTGNITGGSTGGAGATNNNGASCSTTGTPEPGSLALAGLALVGVFAARRRPVATLQTLHAA